MASAEEIREDATVVAILSWPFHIKRSTKNSAQGFPKCVSPFQTFSLGSFPDGHLRYIQQIWEMFQHGLIFASGHH